MRIFVEPGLIWASPVLLAMWLAGCAESAAEEAALPGPATEATAGEHRRVPAGRMAPSAPTDIGRLIAQLDDEQFAVRDEASQELATSGPRAVPWLVAALGAPSSEQRLRARLLLTQYNSFEEVAPHLVSAMGKQHAVLAHAVLLERTAGALDLACLPPNAERLFKFWGMDGEVFRNRALIQLQEARTRADVAKSVSPLLGLCDKTSRFSAAVTRLEAMSLSCDHQYSPGFVIAQTLARGLADDRPELVTFADRYLKALERLVFELQVRDTPNHTVRKEVSDRANMSQGAAAYLVQIIDEHSPQRALFDRWIMLAPELLVADFCAGLASTNPEEYDRGIGKVHIVHMLTEALAMWPDVPQEGVVPQLVDELLKTASAGDKPKALAWLDVLDACQDLARHGLDVRQGTGKLLAERLFREAERSANNRAYHPSRIVHDRFMKLRDLGITPEHKAFPARVYEQYLQGVDEITSDEQRLAIDRYLRILEQLSAAGLSLDQPGVSRFALTLRDRLASPDHDLLIDGVGQLDRLLAAHNGGKGKSDRLVLDQALGMWIADAAAQ